MKAISSDTGVGQFPRQGKKLREVRLGTMKGRVEARDLWNMWRGRGDRFDRSKIVRLMKWRERHQLAKVGDYGLINSRRLGVFRAAMDHPVADSGHWLAGQ